MPRNINTVILDIIELIPEENKDFINSLNRILKNFIYTAPEMINSKHYWNELSIILNQHIKEDDYNNKFWAKKIIDILMDPNYKNV